jgi:hypothetical protein
VTKRVRTRRSEGPVPAALYWGLFRLSPLIMLVGMAAGAVLGLRSILIWGVEDPDHAFGVDIPIAAALLVIWAVAVALLLMPPRSVLARRDHVSESSVLVWPLGRRFRPWMMIAVPAYGLLALMVALAIPVLLGSDPGVPANLWLGVPLAIGFTVFAAATTWIFLRAAVLGVELTSTHVIARDYFFTRRYPRDAIVSVNAVALKGWPYLVLDLLLDGDVEYTLQLSLASGDEPVLYAANSHEDDVELGAEMIRAWRQHAE